MSSLQSGRRFDSAKVRTLKLFFFAEGLNGSASVEEIGENQKRETPLICFHPSSWVWGLHVMSTKSSCNEDAGRENGREDIDGNRKGNGVSGTALYISFGTPPCQQFQVQFADCIPCEVAKQAPSRNNDRADPVPKKKKRLKLQDCFGDWGSPPVEADFVSALDADSEESLIPRSFRFDNYPDLTEFLLGHRDDFFHHSANCRTNKAHDFNNDLTVRLVRFADSKGYQFQSLLDDGILCDDLPTGAEQLPAFKQIRDKVRSFYQRLKSRDKKSESSANRSILTASDSVTADGTRKVDKEDHASTETKSPSPETEDDNVCRNHTVIDSKVSNETDDSVVDCTQIGAKAARGAVRIIPRSWHWNQYGCFEKFLMQNQNDFVHYATRHAGTQKQTDYNNKITEELLVLANQNRYRFQCMDDCNEGDMGQVSTRTGFAFLRYRIKTYYRRQVDNENRRIAHRDSKVNEEPLSPAAIEESLNDEGKAALRALFQTFIRRGTVDTMQLAKAVEATGYTDTFILESARRARQRLFSNSTT